MAIASLDAAGAISFKRERYHLRWCDQEAAVRSPYRTRSTHNASGNDCLASSDRGGAVCVHKPHPGASHGAGVRPTTLAFLPRPSLQYEKCDCQYSKFSCRYRDVCGRVGFLGSGIIKLMITKRGFYVGNGLFREGLAEIDPADFASKDIAERIYIQLCLMCRGDRVRDKYM